MHLCTKVTFFSVPLGIVYIWHERVISDMVIMHLHTAAPMAKLVTLIVLALVDLVILPCSEVGKAYLRIHFK